MPSAAPAGGWLRAPGRALFGSPLRARLSSGTLWATAAAVFNQGTNLAAGVLAARLLGVASFGELGMINATVATFGILAGMGLGLAATKHVAELHRADPERAGRLVGFLARAAAASGALVCGAAAAAAPQLAARVLGAPHLAAELRIGCALMFFNALNGVEMGVLCGLEAFRKLAWLQLAAGAVGVALIAGGAWRWGLAGAVGGYAATAAATWALLRVAAARELRARGVRPRAWGFAEHRAMLWGFALPAIVVALSMQPFAWAARVLLANSEGGYAQLGLFSAAFTLGQLVLFLPEKVVGPVLPVMTSLVAEGNARQFRRLFETTFALCLALAAASALPLALAAPLAMGAYGGAFRGGGTVLVVMLAGFCVAALSGQMRGVLTAFGRMWTQVVYSLVAGVTLVGAAWALVPSRGALGLALAYLAAFVAQFVVQAALTRSVVGRGRAPAREAVCAADRAG